LLVFLFSKLLKELSRDESVTVGCGFVLLVFLFSKLLKELSRDESVTVGCGGEDVWLTQISVCVC
jgi:hypothetical protein